MRLYFATIGLTLLIVAASGLALCFDGGAYFFQILDSRMPVVPYFRIGAILMQAPLLVFEHFTDILPLLGVVFNLSYDAIPFFSLLICWRILQGFAPALFV